MKRAASGAADRKAAEGKTTSFIMKDGKGSVKMKMMNAAGRMIQVPERPLEPRPELEPEVDREDKLDYISDHLKDFIEFTETYVSDIVDEFWRLEPWKVRLWRKEGVVLGGFKEGRG